MSLALIAIRPFRLIEATFAAGGGVLLVVSGIVMPGESLDVLAGQWNIYGFCPCLMTVSAVADIELFRGTLRRMSPERLRENAEADELAGHADVTQAEGCPPEGNAIASLATWLEHCTPERLIVACSQGVRVDLIVLRPRERPEGSLESAHCQRMSDRLGGMRCAA